jgi:acetyltransferase-like isoleucine patch superfamily enzyme
MTLLDRELCKCANGAYITINTTVEDDVFIGPCVVTTNDKQMVRGAELKGCTIRRGARIGANSVILPGVIIGKMCCRCRSVVTKDVSAGRTVAGNPARILKSGDK